MLQNATPLAASHRSAVLPSPDGIAQLVPQLRKAFHALKAAQSAPAGADSDAALASLKEYISEVTGEDSFDDALLVALMAVPSQELDALEVALETAARDLGSVDPNGEGGHEATTIKAAIAVSLASHKTFLAMPLKSRKEVVKVLPEEVRPVAVALQFVTPEKARSLARRLPELNNAMKLIARTQSQSEEENAQEDKQDPAAIYTAKVKAAKLLHDSYMDLPDRSRRAMFQALPKEARPIAEMAEGVKTEEDFKTLLSFVEEKNEQSTGAAKSDDTSEEDEAKGKAKAGARLVARAETRRLWTWVRGDCGSAKVLNFLAGLALVVSGASGIIIETFNKFRIFQIGICFYIALFGAVFMILEAKSQLCSTYAVGRVEKYAGCLNTSVGRAIVLAFCGLLCFSVFDPSTSGWTEVLLFSAGAFACALGVINFIVGCCAQKHLNIARGRIASENQLQEAFYTYDVGMRGILEPEDLVAMLGSLDPPTILTKHEIHAMMLQLDSDRDGGISWNELKKWWSGDRSGNSFVVSSSTVESNPAHNNNNSAEATLTQPLTSGTTGATNEMQLKWMASTAGYFSLRIWNVVVLVLFTLSCTVMIFVELFYRSTRDATGKGVWILMAILQLVLALIGFVCVILEARLKIRGENVALFMAEHARFLNRVWGRGFFYLFVSTLALGVGTMLGSIEDISTLIVGGLLMATSLVNIVVGALASRLLDGFGSLSIADAKREFKEADKDRNGYLDMIELHAVIAKFGIKLSRAQFEAACVEIDADGDGRITETEFVAWTQRKDVTDLVEAGANGEWETNEVE